MTRESPTKPTILVVEDDPVHVEIVRIHLGRLGDRVGDVTVVGRLDEALAHIDANRVELVLLDLSLPDSPLEDSLPRIREFTERGATVVAMSALDTPEIAAGALAAGATAFVDKGKFDADVIARAIRGEDTRDAPAGGPAAPDATRHATGPTPTAKSTRASELDLRLLAARIAHDANSWLTNQTFRLAALRADARLADEEDTRKHLASLGDSAEALAALVSSARSIVLDETSDVALESVDVEAWLTPFVEGWRDASGRAGVTVVAPRVAPPVAASPNGLACVFEALLTNASDPSGREGATVEIRVGPSSEGSVTFDVVDDGGPWSVPSVERLADPLVTGEPGSARAGLGLFRARRWMERMGGSLAVVERDDEPGAYAVRLTFDAR